MFHKNICLLILTVLLKLDGTILFSNFDSVFKDV